MAAVYRGGNTPNYLGFAQLYKAPDVAGAIRRGAEARIESDENRRAEKANTRAQEAHANDMSLFPLRKKISELIHEDNRYTHDLLVVEQTVEGANLKGERARQATRLQMLADKLAIVEGKEKEAYMILSKKPQTVSDIGQMKDANSPIRVNEAWHRLIKDPIYQTAIGKKEIDGYRTAYENRADIAFGEGKDTTVTTGIVALQNAEKMVAKAKEDGTTVDPDAFRAGDARAFALSAQLDGKSAPQKAIIMRVNDLKTAKDGFVTAYMEGNLKKQQERYSEALEIKKKNLQIIQIREFLGFSPDVDITSPHDYMILVPKLLRKTADEADMAAEGNIIMTPYAWGGEKRLNRTSAVALRYAAHALETGRATLTQKVLRGMRHPLVQRGAEAEGEAMAQWFRLNLLAMGSGDEDATAELTERLISFGKKFAFPGKQSIFDMHQKNIDNAGDNLEQEMLTEHVQALQTGMVLPTPMLETDQPRDTVVEIDVPEPK